MNRRVAKIVVTLRQGGWRITGGPSSYEQLFEHERKTDFRFTRLRALSSLGYEIDLQRPRSFNEKLIHRRLFSRDEIWPIVTDKVQVREWIAQNGLLEHVNLIPSFGIFSDPNEIHFRASDYPLVVKAAWASGYNFFLKSPEDNRLSLKHKLRKIKQRPYQVHRLVWASHQIPRRFIVEKMLLHEHGGIPADYKFFVFHGRSRLIQVDLDRGTNHRQSFFTRDGKKMNLSYLAEDTGLNKLPSAVMDQMVPIADKFGEYFDFIRVDLYLHEGVVYFGELTQTPNLGFVPFTPREFDFELGKEWSYPSMEKA